MFQTLSYIGILISELAQRAARRGSRNATKRRSKITYSIMTLAAKPTHNNQKKKGKPPLCRTVYPYRQIPQRFTCVHQGYPSNHAHLLRTSFAPNVLRASRTSRAQSLLRTLSAYYAALRTAARYTGIRLQRAAPPPRKWRVIFACHVNQFFCLATSAPQKMPFAAYFCAAPIIAIMLQV